MTTSIVLRALDKFCDENDSRFLGASVEDVHSCTFLLSVKAVEEALNRLVLDGVLLRSNDGLMYYRP
jgi:hypothetical protein